MTEGERHKQLLEFLGDWAQKLPEQLDLRLTSYPIQDLEDLEDDDLSEYERKQQLVAFNKAMSELSNKVMSELSKPYSRTRIKFIGTFFTPPDVSRETYEHATGSADKTNLYARFCDVCGVFFGFSTSELECSCVKCKQENCYG